ncbi:MAG: ATP-binding protein [Firmicutes bacterium]|nr:ATP-binding protein [Candidatus Fermentithermobacillaceae bacterium]
MERIERKKYLEWLIRWREQDVIKVVSGVRRCGKSTMLEIYRDYLLRSGVKERQMVAINFEDIEFEHLTDYKLLYEHVKSLLRTDETTYVFLDEVQYVTDFERAVDSLFIRPNVDLYITGSNAYFMSGELATLLSGRYVELRMLPLSFSEFSSALRDSGLSKSQRFSAYLSLGSFPYIVRSCQGQRDAQEYLRSIYNSVLLKDVVARLGISDVTSLENVAKFLMHNIGSKVSSTKIANTMKSMGKGVDQKTVDRYIRGLTDAMLLYEARRFNIKGKQLLATQSKYFAVDIALRNTMVRTEESDIGHILENIVYLELLRRGYEVFVGEMGDGEVDFVAVSPGETAYYQVAATTLDENVLRRELAPLRKIPDNHPKFLLTLDEVFAEANYDGIRKMNVLDWLLEDRE